MAIVILERPPQVAPAFNPIIVVLQTPKARYAQLQADYLKVTDPAKRQEIRNLISSLEGDKDQDTIDPIGVNVQACETSFHTVIVREPDNQGKAEIDISYIIRRGFANEFNNASQAYTHYDGNLRITYAISSDLEQEAAFTGVAINSVRQPDQGAMVDGVFPLTQTPMVRYVGYPLDYTFQQIPYIGCNVKVLHRNGMAYDNNHMPMYNGNVRLSGGIRDIERVTINNPSLELLFDSAVQVGVTPADPFYVRWINWQAGWNYHMFSIHEMEDKVGDYESVQLQKGQQTVALAVERRVTVAESLMFREEFDILAGIAISPRIEWYNEGAKGWQVIVVADDFTSTWSPRNRFGEVVFTFSLPKPLTQF